MNASNINSLCLVVGVLVASACSTARRERTYTDDRYLEVRPPAEFQDPVDSLIDSMVKDRSTWVDPVSSP